LAQEAKNRKANAWRRKASITSTNNKGTQTIQWRDRRPQFSKKINQHMTFPFLLKPCLKLNQTRHSLAWPIQHYGPEIPAEFCNAKCLYLGKCNKVYTS
jgi:hypothetical protein